MAASGNGTSTPQRWIATYMVIGGTLAVVVISAMALWFADTKTRAETARLVFASVLPLLGTWVGTVLAFYFGRENFATASQETRNTLSAAGALTPTTPVTDLMIPYARINPKQEVQDRAAAEALKLGDLLANMKDADQNRVPIFDTNHVALYVVHAADIDKYCANAQNTTSGTLAAPDTLAKALADLGDSLRAAIGFAVVPTTASIADARAQLASKPQCKDVFVTDGGHDTDKVVGWLTNTDLARVSS